MHVRQGGRAGEDHENCPAGLTGPINLPADDSVHAYSPYSDEWWYYSSHLATVDADREFGFAQIVYTLIDPTSSLQCAERRGDGVRRRQSEAVANESAHAASRGRSELVRGADCARAERGESVVVVERPRRG